VGAEANAEIEHASPYGKAPVQKTADGRRVLGARAARLFEQQPPQPEAPASAAAPWPSTAGAPSAPGPGLGIAAAVVILGVRALRDWSAGTQAPAGEPPAGSDARATTP
jgi:membrane protein